MNVGVATGREHYKLECVADALFWLFETTTLKIIVKNLAEVGATGRYIPFPLVCR